MSDDQVQALREHVLLPSDMLAIARRRNPAVKIEFRHVGQRLALVVTTERGEAVYERHPGERWRDLFQRSGLLWSS